MLFIEPNRVGSNAVCSFHLKALAFVHCSTCNVIQVCRAISFLILHKLIFALSYFVYVYFICQSKDCSCSVDRMEWLLYTKRELSSREEAQKVCGKKSHEIQVENGKEGEKNDEDVICNQSKVFEQNFTRKIKLMEPGANEGAPTTEKHLKPNIVLLSISARLHCFTFLHLFTEILVDFLFVFANNRPYFSQLHFSRNLLTALFSFRSSEYMLKLADFVKFK